MKRSMLLYTNNQTHVYVSMCFPLPLVAPLVLAERAKKISDELNEH